MATNISGRSNERYIELNYGYRTIQRFWSFTKRKRYVNHSFLNCLLNSHNFIELQY